MSASPVSGGPASVAEQMIASHERRADFFRTQVKASARKSYGSYKPLLVFPDGRTEVQGQRSETRYRVSDGRNYDPRTAYTHNERGKTFSERADAIAYAKRCIDWYAAQADKEAAKHRAMLATREGATP